MLNLLLHGKNQSSFLYVCYKLVLDRKYIENTVSLILYVFEADILYRRIGNEIEKKDNCPFYDSQLQIIFARVLLGCPRSMTVNPPATSGSYLVNTTLSCSSMGGVPSPVYYWLKGRTLLSLGAMVTVSELGPFSLICVANSSFNGSHCATQLTVSGTAVLVLPLGRLLVYYSVYKLM